MTPNDMPRISLNNGQSIPQLGLGVYKVSQNAAVELVHEAIKVGYRRVDTAALYGNEAEVGEAIRTSGVPRDDIFVTTKIWNDRQGSTNAPAAIEESLQKLDIGYIDMLLIHWPCPTQNLFVETWKVFEEALRTGKIRGIGVSNFEPHHIESLVASGSSLPALNQVELHPAFQQPDVRRYNREHGIATEAWSPLGRGRYEDNSVLSAIAATHERTVAQVILRWHIQIGNLVIPKTGNFDRLVENISIFDFELSDLEMQAIASLDAGARTGLNPNEFG